MKNLKFFLRDQPYMPKHIDISRYVDARSPWKILEFWQSINLYEAMLKKNEAGKHFVLHDGPPYANGKIHIGHALDKTIKDIIPNAQK